MASVEIKGIDEQGRIIIPKRWRGILKGDKVVLKLKRDSIEVLPWERFDLTNFFDSVEVDLKSELADWHAVRREIRRRKN